MTARIYHLPRREAERARVRVDRPVVLPSGARVLPGTYRVTRRQADPALLCGVWIARARIRHDGRTATSRLDVKLLDGEYRDLPP